MENEKAYLVITKYRDNYYNPPAKCRKFTAISPKSFATFSRSSAIRYAKEEAKWASVDMVIVTTSGGTIEMTIPGDSVAPNDRQYLNRGKGKQS